MKHCSKFSLAVNESDDTVNWSQSLPSNKIKISKALPSDY